MILDPVLIGVAIALDPLPLTAFLVVCPRAGRAKRRSVRVRWLVSLAIVVTVTVLATSNNPPQPNPRRSLRRW